MTDDPRVDRLLAELLESGGSPEEACRDCPELLPQVRAGLLRLRLLEQEVDVMFPPSDPSGGVTPAAPPSAEPPRIPGYEVEEVAGPRRAWAIVYRRGTCGSTAPSPSRCSWPGPSLPRPSAALRAGGGAGGRAETPEPRAGLRRGRTGRAAVLHHGVRRGGQPGRGHRRHTTAGPAGRRAGGNARRRRRRRRTEAGSSTATSSRPTSC